jgi:hypothetical protein
MGGSAGGDLGSGLEGRSYGEGICPSMESISEAGLKRGLRHVGLVDLGRRVSVSYWSLMGLIARRGEGDK